MRERSCPSSCPVEETSAGSWKTSPRQHEPRHLPPQEGPHQGFHALGGLVHVHGLEGLRVEHSGAGGEGAAEDATRQVSGQHGGAGGDPLRRQRQGDLAFEGGVGEALLVQVDRADVGGGAQEDAGGGVPLHLLHQGVSLAGAGRALDDRQPLARLSRQERRRQARVRVAPLQRLQVAVVGEGVREVACLVAPLPLPHLLSQRGGVG